MIPGYDTSKRWVQSTYQGNDCQYNPVLTLKRAADSGGDTDQTGDNIDPNPPTPTPDNNNDDDTNPPAPVPEQ